MILVSCSCGATYTKDQWEALPFAGHQDDFEGGWLELRNCPCGSTRAMQINFEPGVSDHWYIVADPSGHYRAMSGIWIRDNELPIDQHIIDSAKTYPEACRIASELNLVSETHSG